MSGTFGLTVKIAANQDRTDKKQHFSEKVTKVESILAADSKQQ